MTTHAAQQRFPTHRKPGRHWPGFCLCAGIAMAALLAPLPSCAQPQVASSPQYLARMDGDGDGRVSLPEYQQWMGYAFAAMDRDGDGVLVSAELPGGRGTAITRSQHRERLAAAFARQDRNRDGALDARELAAPPR